MSGEIENPWVAYDMIGMVCVGRIVAEYINSVDIQLGDNQRHPITFIKTDIKGRFADPREALNCACEHGRDRKELESFFRESFGSVKLDPAE